MILKDLSLSLNDVPIEFSQLRNNFNAVISSLNINISKLSNFIFIDSSLLSKIRSGQHTPSNPVKFIESVSTYIVQNYNDTVSKEIISSIINCKINDLENNSNYLELLKKWMSSNTSSNNTAINSF